MFFLCQFQLSFMQTPDRGERVVVPLADHSLDRALLQSGAHYLPDRRGRQPVSLQAECCPRMSPRPCCPSLSLSSLHFSYAPTSSSQINMAKFCTSIVDLNLFLTLTGISSVSGTVNKLDFLCHLTILFTD